MCPLGYGANEPSLLKLLMTFNHLKKNPILSHPNETFHDLSMDIFPLSHLVDLCALFPQTPYSQLGSANREYSQTGGKEGNGVRLPPLQLPPYILTSSSSTEDRSSCQGASSTEHSLSRVWRLFMPTGSSTAFLMGQHYFCGFLDAWHSSEHSTLIKLWNPVSYCIAGDSLPSWPPGHSLLFPMLNHLLSPPLANPFICTLECSPYVI